MRPLRHESLLSDKETRNRENRIENLGTLPEIVTS